MKLSDQYPGQVCPTCEYTYGNDRGECGNPTCFANPSLSDAFKAQLVERTERYHAEQAERRERQRLFALSMKR